MKCSQKECEKVAVGKGFCDKHLSRVRRHGDPDTVLYRTATKWKDVRCRNLWHGAKDRAKRKGIEFSIKPESIVIPECCPVLGTPFAAGSRAFQDNSPSLDRIDNSKGYIEGNIIVVSYLANRIKSNATPDQILRIGNFFKNLQSGD